MTGFDETLKTFAPLSIVSGLGMMIFWPGKKNSFSMIGGIALIGIGLYGMFLRINNPSSSKSGYTHSYATTMPVTTLRPRQYTPVQRRIITGTSQTTQTNPSYDKNTVFPVIGDVY